MNPYLAGALGGLLATVPMTIAMEKLHRKLPREERYPLPPRQIMEDLVERSPIDRPADNRSMAELTLASHFLYGAATGAFYGLLLHKRPSPILRGAGFGVAVWAASYLGWIPAAKILRPATEHPARRNLLMLTAHCIWGASAAGVARMLAEPEVYQTAFEAQTRPEAKRDALS